MVGVKVKVRLYKTYIINDVRSEVLDEMFGIEDSFDIIVDRSDILEAHQTVSDAKDNIIRGFKYVKK